MRWSSVIGTRRRRILAVLGLMTGIAIIVVLAGVPVMGLGARAAGQAFKQVLFGAGTNATASFKADAHLRAAADLVIERDSRGGYAVSGSLAPGGLHAASPADLRQALEALPRRGAVFIALVETPWLLMPTGSASAAEQAAVEELVRNCGFDVVRGSYRASFPRDGRRPRG